MVRESLIKVCKVLWISTWATLATLLLFVPMTMAALMSSTGNLAFTLSKLWAWIMLTVTNIHPQIRNREKILCRPKNGESRVNCSGRFLKGIPGNGM